MYGDTTGKLRSSRFLANISLKTMSARLIYDQHAPAGEMNKEKPMTIHQDPHIS